jgi:SP family xylose:H+ symportor-like MFS transporter
MAQNREQQPRGMGLGTFEVGFAADRVCFDLHDCGSDSALAETRFVMTNRDRESAAGATLGRSAPGGKSLPAKKAAASVCWRYLLPICFVATLGGLLFGYDTGVISGAIEPLTSNFHLSDLMKGWTSGCVLLGCAGGVLLAGPMSDAFGRKRAMLVAAVLFVVSGLGTALAVQIWTFIVFRVLGGIGIGVASISTPMYLAEITPAQVRGRLISVNQIAIVSGIAATALINFAVAHSKGDPSLPSVQSWLTQIGWRWMFAAGMVPAVAFGILLLPIPESPRWLVEQGRDVEAKEVLARAGGAVFAQAELAGIQGSLAQERASWRRLFGRALRLPVLLGIVLAILQQVTGINVFLYFGASIFKSLSASTGVDAGLLEQFIINGAGVFFTLIAIATVDHWGRRPLLLLGAAGMGLSLVAMGLLANLASNEALVSGWMLLLILLYIGSFSLSVGPVTWVILAEIYPTAVRGRALGLATFFLWLADYGVTQTFPLMDAKDSWFVRSFHHAFPFYVYALFCVVLILVVWRKVPETKGRSLEEIERQWNSTFSMPATCTGDTKPQASNRSESTAAG